MRRIALFTCTLFLALTTCAAQADEVVITLGGRLRAGHARGMERRRRNL